MKDCNNFAKLLNDYVTESLSADKSKFMLTHINSCENCRKLYELQLKRRKSMESISAVNEVDFISSREEIMTKISDKKYTKKLPNKLYYFFRRNTLKYAANFAVLIFVLTSIFFGTSYFKWHGLPTSVLQLSGNNEEEIYLRTVYQYLLDSKSTKLSYEMWRKEKITVDEFTCTFDLVILNQVSKELLQLPKDVPLIRVNWYIENSLADATFFIDKKTGKVLGIAPQD